MTPTDREFFEEGRFGDEDHARWIDTAGGVFGRDDATTVITAAR